MPNDPADNQLMVPLRRLTAMDPNGCAPLPPRRIPLEDGHECLIEWRRGTRGDQWLLNLYKRPVSVDETEAPVRQFNATISLGEHEPTVSWQNPDDRFADWVRSALPEIAASMVDRQQEERQHLIDRAVTIDPPSTVRDFIPHIVILIALVAFAYMFAAVHIKP